MEFPPVWEFVEPDQFEAYQYRRMEDAQPGFDLITLTQDGRIGDFRLVLGGTRIISIKFGADKIFGPTFAGKITLPPFFPSSSDPSLASE